MGSRLGLSLAFIWWSLASVGRVRGGVRSFGAARFLLGVGERAISRAIKTWASGFRQGAGAGHGHPERRDRRGGHAGAAPGRRDHVLLRLAAAFILTGTVGFLCSSVADPGAPPRRASLHHARELAYIRAGQPSTTPPPLEQSDAGVWREALRTRELWALMAARLLSDPGWLFFSFWIPKFFKSEHGFDLKSISLFVGCLSWPPTWAASRGAGSRRSSWGGAGPCCGPASSPCAAALR